MGYSEVTIDGNPGMKIEYHTSAALVLQTREDMTLGGWVDVPTGGTELPRIHSLTPSAGGKNYEAEVLTDPAHSQSFFRINLEL